MKEIPKGLDYTSKPDDYYQNERPEMQALLPAGARTILDVGCSNGAFGMALKQRTGREVWGIEPMESFGEEAAEKLDKVLIAPVEGAIEQLPDGYFDAVYFNDVLEHLLDPYSLLKDIRAKLKPGGRVISSIPNIRYFRAFSKILFKGEWDYADQGIMDRTHLRFFTKKSIVKMYRAAGYEVETHMGINASKSLKPYLLNLLLLGSAGDMRYMQFATVAKMP